MQAVLTLGGIAFDGGANITRNGHGWGLQAITDWHSLTASKAQINERPQAHGAFDPGTDWRKSTANEIKAAYWGHDHNDLIRAIQQLTALANRDELMECTMDVDGVVLRRMVSVRNVDVPDTRGRSNLQGIVVDLLAPDPRAYGPVSSDSTGLPVHGGGLVFDTSPSTQWTGDKNASTSTLSQDGAVVATNYVTDPNALQKVGTWSPAGSTTAVQRPDGHWVYTPDSDVTRLAFFIPITPLAQDDYVYCEWLGGTRDASLENIDTVAHGNGWILGKNTNPAGNKTIYPVLNGTPITILKVGRYSAADYAAMQALGVNWFSGDSYPGHLLFPVGFGSPGSDGRARFVNTGTAPASVTMTVMGGGSEGITLKRVENGAVLTLSRPCNPDDRIIFDSSDGSVLLNGQAELSGWMTADDFDGFDVHPGETCTVQFGVVGDPVGVPLLEMSAAPAYW
ncbi:hypothetical protein WM014_00020 [Bifidobacterium mongoliense]|uniref:hypothetical protein n=1 Tax=Bifidobacterium mongoliense TaxID=518643 RepID=UPI0030EDAE1D